MPEREQPVYRLANQSLDFEPVYVTDFEEDSNRYEQVYGIAAARLRADYEDIVMTLVRDKRFANEVLVHSVREFNRYRES